MKLTSDVGIEPVDGAEAAALVDRLSVGIMASIDWTSLPSVIVVEILSYLSNKDKLAAGATCKTWRECLFSPSNWKRIKFTINNALRHESRRSKYLAKQCGRFVKTAVLEMDSRCPSDVQDSLEVLEILSRNPSLLRVSLCPTSCRLEHQNRTVIDKYVEVFNTIMEGAKKLQAISFGCVEELLDHIETFLYLLGQHQANSLRALYISSVKEDPENYALARVHPSMFDPFTQLQELSLDYDYVSSDLLAVLSKAERVPLQRLIMHVHSTDLRCPIENDEAWRKLSAHSPNLEVTLILLHSLDAPDDLLDILQPSMRLTHFHQYFCGQVNTDAINLIARLYPDILQSLAIVDSLENGTRPCYYNAPDEDPFVMLAWRCKNLVHFTLIGYRVFHENIVAIARLRGSQLQTLDVPDCCICPGEDDQDLWQETQQSHQTMIKEVSKNLGRPWEPIPDNKLHPAIRDWNQDADGVYMPLILRDHMWL